ncbi:Protein MCM10 [Gossypium australe]|uniref:Protein MCM10 n=1 Tax=Gossypium australe TaxID=47621 RepID=A0A5B6VKD2_9ROSI|nr:Protein MCM10 [Gossypium australe]
MDPDRAVADDVESNAPAPAQGIVPFESRPVSCSQGGEAKEAFFQMMNEWFTYSTTSTPPNPQSIPVAPQGLEPLRLNKPPIDRIRKYGAEEFRATIDNDPERAEFWLENTIHIYDKLSCTPAECLKCAILLLRDTAYQWWNMLVHAVATERVTWEFFQTEFRNQRFLNQKHKEFLELKQGRMTVTEYEREFVWLSKYAREFVSTEEIMCKRFVNNMNEDIKLLVEILELKEFVALVDRACKAEELSQEKRKAERKKDR